MEIEDYKKIISMAIVNEIAAYEFYNGVSETTNNDMLKIVFRELADEEKRHRDSLEACLTGNHPIRLGKVKDQKISEQVEKPKLSAKMSPVDAIVLAMKEEEEAAETYQALADISELAEQKAMFLALATMERDHKAKLEDIYTKMKSPVSW